MLSDRGLGYTAGYGDGVMFSQEDGPEALGVTNEVAPATPPGQLAEGSA
jgi:hypothetical protein